VSENTGYGIRDTEYGIRTPHAELSNVLFISGIGGDTRRYRCLHHQEQLALHGIHSTLREADDPQLYVDITTHDLVILHRVAYSERIADLVELTRARGLPLIFETDDLIFEPELYRQIGFVDTLSPEAAERFRTDLYGQARAFALCDAVLTTTEFLAEAATRHGKRAFVQRNACSAEMLHTANLAYQTRQQFVAQDGKPIILGYFSGTGSHNRDFASITPALLTVLERYPNVWLHVSGQLELEARFLAYRDRIRRAPFVPWQELPQLLSQIDINLAPLELDNPFCQSKSEIKYTEAALVGVPTIASPIQAFRYAIKPGETGLLAADHDAWVAALTQLIESAAERQRLGNAARKQVYAEYNPQARSEQLIATLAEIRQSTPGEVANLAHFSTLLATAMKRELDQLQAANQLQTRQLEQLRQTISMWTPKPDDAARDFWRRSYEQIQQQHLETLRDILTRLHHNS